MPLVLLLFSTSSPRLAQISNLAWSSRSHDRPRSSRCHRSILLAAITYAGLRILDSVLRSTIARAMPYYGSSVCASLRGTRPRFVPAGPGPPFLHSCVKVGWESKCSTGEGGSSRTREDTHLFSHLFLFFWIHLSFLVPSRRSCSVAVCTGLPRTKPLNAHTILLRILTKPSGPAAAPSQHVCESRHFPAEALTGWLAGCMAD